MERTKVVITGGQGYIGSVLTGLLARTGFEVVVLPVDRYGRLDPDQLDGAINDRTILVSLMLANNEVGTIQPLAELVRRVRRNRNVLIHLDAIQAAVLRVRLPHVDRWNERRRSNAALYDRLFEESGLL